MKRSFLLLLLLVPGCMALFSAENRIANPSFEDGEPRRLSTPLPHWEIRSFEEVFSFHSIDTTQARTGKRCALIRIPAGNPKASGYFTPQRKITVEGGRKYRFSVWSRGSAGTITLTRYTADGKYAGMGGVKQAAVKAGEQWHETTLDYHMPPSKQPWKIGIQLGMSGAGEIRYDDACFAETQMEKNIIEFYPTSANTEKTLYPVEGEPNPLLFYVFASERGGEFTLELKPSGKFHLLAATPVHCGENFSGKAVRTGDTITIPIYSLAVLPLRKFTSDLMIGTGLLYQAEAGTLAWEIRRNGTRIGKGSFQIKPCRGASGRLPEKFTVGNWYSPFLSAVTDENAVTSWAKAMRRSGFVSGSFRNPLHMRKISSLGIHPQFCFWQVAPGRCLTKLLKSDILERRIKGMRKSAGDLKQVSSNWNFEPNLGEYYHMCPDCAREFEAFTGKSAAGAADGKALEKKYPDEYLAFRNTQMRKLIELYAKLCHDAGIQASLCSLSVPVKRTEESMLFLKRSIGNLSEYEKILDEYQPQIYQRPSLLWDPIESMQEYYPSATVVFTSDERNSASSCPYSLLTPESAYLEPLTAAMLGIRKIMLFVGCHTFDGRQILAFRKALDTIARYEDFFFDGKGKTIYSSADSPLRGRLYSRNGKQLLGILNPSEHDPEIFEFRNPVGGISFRDAESGKILIRKDGGHIFEKEESVRIAMPPASVRFFELTRQGPPAAGTGERMPEKEKQTGRVILNSAGWKLTDSGSGIIRIEKNAESMEIRYSDGAVIVMPGVLYRAKGSGGIFRDLFYEPAECRWNEDARAVYRLEGTKLEKGSLKITFSHKMKDPRLSGLVLTKTFTIHPAFSEIRADIRLQNPSRRPAEIAYWAHNRFDIPVGKAVVKFGSQKRTLSEEITPNVFLSSGGVSREICYADRWILSWNAGKEGPAPEKAYLWQGDNVPSLELIGTKQTIAPGEEVTIRLHLRKKR